MCSSVLLYRLSNAKQGYKLLECSHSGVYKSSVYEHNDELLATAFRTHLQTSSPSMASWSSAVENEARPPMAAPMMYTNQDSCPVNVASKQKEKWVTILHYFTAIYIHCSSHNVYKKSVLSIHTSDKAQDTSEFFPSCAYSCQP